MTDLTQTIIAKSDQLNSDDLIGRSITIKITKVTGQEGEQPISIHYEGDAGKPWKPCKSMRRVLVGVWGPDGKVYAGRTLVLYRDDAVIFGGVAVGGIRISHMSHIENAITLSLTATKKSKKPFTVKPFNPGQNTQQAAAAAPAQIKPLTPEEIEAAQVEARKGTKALGEWWKGLLTKNGEQRRYQAVIEDLKRIAAESDAVIDDEIPF